MGHADRLMADSRTGDMPGSSGMGRIRRMVARMAGRVVAIVGTLVVARIAGRIHRTATVSPAGTP